MFVFLIYFEKYFLDFFYKLPCNRYMEREFEVENISATLVSHFRFFSQIFRFSQAMRNYRCLMLDLSRIGMWIEYHQLLGSKRHMFHMKFETRIHHLPTSPEIQNIYHRKRQLKTFDVNDVCFNVKSVWFFVITNNESSDAGRAITL